MTWTYLRELATESFVLSSSGLFLAWYIWAKLST
jgi:hypothetical protein